jgi:hypothetical protein
MSMEDVKEILDVDTLKMNETRYVEDVKEILV